MKNSDLDGSADRPQTGPISTRAVHELQCHGLMSCPADLAPSRI